METYESEHTLFMREWLKQHPKEAEEQKRGRALWWDKQPRPLQRQREEADAKVPQKGYYYDIN